MKRKHPRGSSDHDGCIMMLVFLLIILCTLGNKLPTKTTSTKPTATMPADNIVIGEVRDMPDNCSAWIDASDVFLSQQGEVYIRLDGHIEANQSPDRIKVTKTNGQYSINLSGTKYKWKIPLVQPGMVTNGIGQKVSRVEQEIPLEIPLEK